MACKGPLRKVMETIMVKEEIVKGSGNFYEFRREVLECGHQQPVKQDCFGHYYSYRRRCGKCARRTGEGA